MTKDDYTIIASGIAAAVYESEAVTPSNMLRLIRAANRNVAIAIALRLAENDPHFDYRWFVVASGVGVST